MNTDRYTYMILKHRAIQRFKAYYGRFDVRIKQAREARFSFGMNETDCILRLNYYGVRYVQHYKIAELRGRNLC